MGILTSGNQDEVKNALRNSSQALEHEEIAAKTSLSVEETRKAVSELVDRGEVTSTMDWKYKLTE
ncbi:hypothetical protein [Haloarcula amylolytica]|uniref:Replication protein A C-terminal domain-containing protein n=1 Tax=Haloarcula amylolytica JCM 13557 TaxID=1227452 RepID=M0KX19_9EURY|nr:hypothetical protein C442_03081 [Haloarcula amylolytica JCM 13557]